MASKSSLLLILSLLVLQTARGGELTFAPIHDAFTQNGTNRDLNELRVENSGRLRITYMLFDLSELIGPPSSATLFLTGGSDKSSGDMTIRLYAATSNEWTEVDITGDTAPERGAEISSFEGNIEIGQVVEFDVVSMITGPGIYTIIVENDESALDVSFVSKEGEVEEEHPRLVVVEPDVRPEVTEIDYDSVVNEANITWSTLPGAFYDIEISPDLTPGSWQTSMAAVAADGDPAVTTSASVQGWGDASMHFLRVVRVPAPPLLGTSFEDGATDWTVSLFPGGVETGTTWEIGSPTNGPGAARTGDNVAGTGLTADYEDGTTIQLRSPVIDPAGFTGTLNLNFWYYLDTIDGEGGQLGILEANGDLIQDLEPLFTGGEEGNTAEWTEFNIKLPTLEPARPFIVQFQFLSAGGGDPNGAGWFIDDVRVGK